MPPGVLTHFCFPHPAQGPGSLPLQAVIHPDHQEEVREGCEITQHGPHNTQASAYVYIHTHAYPHAHICLHTRSHS